jgi:4-diphosphocytidyl-2-C-methyl-D-erythritol kinase
LNSRCDFNSASGSVSGVEELEQAIERAITETPGKSELAGAKVNLALHVTGRRADGYHNLESLVVFADFADVITAHPTDNHTSVQIKGPFADALADTPSESNLVMRAAAMLGRASGREHLAAYRLLLTKRLPVAAGLGGGSADAAAVLRLLNREWDLNYSEDKLVALAAALGADVPMCVISRPLIARGIGEDISLVAGLPALPLVIVHPGIPMPTPPVFARLKNAENAPLPPLPKRMGSLLDIIFWLRQARNDLAAPAAEINPLAAVPVKLLMSDPECLFARMSGSGAAAYGMFATIEAADRAVSRLRDAKPHWWMTSAMTRPSR